MSLKSWKRYLSGRQIGGRYAVLVLALSWCAWFFNFTVRYLASAVLPMVEDEFNLLHGQSGFLITTNLVMYAAASFCAGAFSRRLGQKRTVLLFIVTLTACAVLVGISTSYAQLVVMMALMGFTLGLYIPAAVALLSGWFPASRIGRVLGIHETAASMGKIVGVVVVAAFVLSVADWRYAYLFMVPAGAVLALVWWLAVQDRGKRETTGHEKISLRAHRSTALFIIPFSFNILASQGVFAMLTVYLVGVYGIDAAFAATIYALVHAGGAVGTVVGGFLNDRVGSERLSAYLLAISGAFTLALIPLGFNAALFVLLFALNFTFTAYFSVTFALVSLRMPPQLRASMLGLFLGVAVLVGGFSATIVGVLADTFGLRASYIFPAVCAFAGLAVLLWLRRTGAGDGGRVQASRAVSVGKGQAP